MPTHKEPTVLKQAWYLITETHYGRSSTTRPRLPQTTELADTLHHLLYDTQPAGAAHLSTAMELLLAPVAYLSDTVPHADLDRAALGHLLHGFNLLLAHTTQLTGRLAYRVNAGDGDLARLDGTDRDTTVTALATATARLAEAAALFKEAYLAVALTSTRR